jgi:hypothetical protein
VSGHTAQTVAHTIICGELKDANKRVAVRRAAGNLYKPNPQNIRLTLKQTQARQGTPTTHQNTEETLVHCHSSGFPTLTVAA